MNIPNYASYVVTGAGLFALVLIYRFVTKHSSGRELLTALLKKEGLTVTTIRYCDSEDWRSAILEASDPEGRVVRCSVFPREEWKALLLLSCAVTGRHIREQMITV